MKSEKLAENKSRGRMVNDQNYTIIMLKTSSVPNGLENVIYVSDS